MQCCTLVRYVYSYLFLHDCLQAVEKYYSDFAKQNKLTIKRDRLTKVGFEGSEITLKIPEDEELKEGWKIISTTYPMVCLCLPNVLTSVVIIKLVQYRYTVHLCRLQGWRQMSLRKGSQSLIVS